MKVGLFGILTLTLTSGQPPLWWGVVLLLAGMITAFVGGLYALMEHNIQRLLAYHTPKTSALSCSALARASPGWRSANRR